MQGHLFYAQRLVWCVMYEDMYPLTDREAEHALAASGQVETPSESPVHQAFTSLAFTFSGESDAAARWAPALAGVLLGQRIRPKAKPDETHQEANPKSNMYLNATVALIGSVLIAQFCITIFAQDVRIFDDQLRGLVMAQPAIGQVVFAVLVSFGLAAFVVKAFLNVSYIWPTIASALVTAFAITIYVKQDVLQHLVERHPAAFFSNAVIAVLPVQMVAFGTLGSIAGYWLAVRYNYWRKHA